MPDGRAEKSTVNSARSAQPNKSVLSGLAPVKVTGMGKKPPSAAYWTKAGPGLGLAYPFMGFAGGPVLIDQPDPQEPGTAGVQGQEPVLPLLHLDIGVNQAVDQHGVPEELRYT